MELERQNWNEEDVRNLTGYLKSIADEKYKKFHSSLVPNISLFFGVRTPQMRTLAKQIAKGNSLSFLETLCLNDESPYEIKVVYGMVIGISKLDYEVKVKFLEKYIPFIDNWAVCDVVTSDLKFIKRSKAEFIEVIRPYFKSDKEFEVRFGVVVLLDYYMESEYIGYVLDVLNNIKHDGYYVKMAVAWAVSVAYIKCPNETMPFLQNNNLDEFTFNKALQKLRESFRVSKEDKDLFKSMKVDTNDK